MNYLVVYDASQTGLMDKEVVAMGAAAVVIGLAVLATFRYKLLSWKLSHRLIVGSGFVAVGLIVALIPYRNYWLLRHHESANVVEGEISYFVPLPITGHGAETFCVQEKCFSYSDYVMAPGFRNTSSRGGPIKLGLMVRVTYVDNTILKLEIAR